ncbi:hypothetical protein BUALT_Bualt05G0081700 [Buddleja alternifolia]|uniref:C2H2-type domain-containing protein n=1 Tax=Buddleja alternifolia TaxID=168488 RepID=A0AAV6XHH8_9LAMI|nr:hypothetical protein BUALT_Bualt05G0081700 [Buddleja alternifolia]
MSNKQQMYEDENDSWEVRAFEEDMSGNLMGCTWPPRSYTCTFCRREFRSAQALGGHMNVHRRDRARLHEVPIMPPAKAPPSSTLLIPTQEIVANGLCLLYSFPNPNGFLIPTPTSMSTMDSPSSLLLSGTSNKSYIDFPLAVAHSAGSSLCHSSNTDPSATDSNDEKDLATKEIDLELRLGRRSSPQP